MTFIKFSIIFDCNIFRAISFEKFESVFPLWTADVECCLKTIFIEKLYKSIILSSSGPSKSMESSDLSYLTMTHSN